MHFHLYLKAQIHSLFVSGSSRVLSGPVLAVCVWGVGWLLTDYLCDYCACMQGQQVIHHGPNHPTLETVGHQRLAGSNCSSCIIGFTVKQPLIGVWFLMRPWYMTLCPPPPSPSISTIYLFFMLIRLHLKFKAINC